MEKQIKDLRSIIIELDNLNKKSKRPLRHYVFRGEDQKYSKIIPSIARQNSPGLLYEPEIIEKAIRENPQSYAGLTSLEKIAKMQHHGIETRLLDVSINPLISLYFACLNKDTDGFLYAWQCEESFFSSDSLNYGIDDFLANAVIDGWFRLSTDVLEFEKEYARHGKRFPNPNFGNDEDDNHYVKDVCSNPIVMYPDYVSKRQVIQQGAFIFFPNKIRENQFVPSELCEIPEPQYTFTIFKESKRNIMDFLDFIGINHGRLFFE